MEKFKGEIIHSKYYKTGESFAGKRVLTMGNSFTGVELSADLSKHAQIVHHSYTLPFWIFEHFIAVDQEKKN